METNDDLKIIQEMMEDYSLEPTDTLADLLEAIREADLEEEGYDMEKGIPGRVE